MKPKNEYFLNLLFLPYDSLLDATGKKEVSKVFDNFINSILEIKKYAEILSDKKWKLSFNLVNDEVFLSAYPPVSMYSRVEIEDALKSIGIKLTNKMGFIDFKEIEEEISMETYCDFSNPLDI